jgi:hypothetical protein
MIDFLKSIFHKCTMETVDIPHSNKKGEIWFQECVCGKQQEVMFNHDGECVSVKTKQWDIITKHTKERF